MSRRELPNPIEFAVDGPDVAAYAIALHAEFSTATHSHPRGQLIGCSRGAVTIRTDMDTWIVPAGYAIWLPPNVPHGGRSFGPGDGWTCYIAPAACRTLPDRPRTALVPPLLREAILRATSWADDGVDEKRQRIADLIVDEIAMLPGESLRLPMPQDPRLQRVAYALLEHPEDNRSADAWAAWSGSTTRTFSRRFPQDTGLSFTKWRQRARLMRSLEMLAEGQAVTTIAIDLGYNSVSGFIALFRRTFGVTPAAYLISR